MIENELTLLADRAMDLSRSIMNVLTRKSLKPSDLDRYRTAGEIGVSLHLISTYLRSLPPYWVDSDVDGLCRTILHDLELVARPVDISMSTARSPSLPLASFFGKSGPIDAETHLVAFFKREAASAQRLERRCKELLERLSPDEADAEVPEAALERWGSADTPTDYNDDILRALQLVTECSLALHKVTSTMSADCQRDQKMNHPTRLCLHEVADGRDSTSSDIRVVVSALNMALWQEFCLRIPPRPLVDEHQELLRSGGLCSYLEEEITACLFLSFRRDHGLSLLTKEARVADYIFQAGQGESLTSVLQNYDLTPKDKVILSYAVARSAWKYYDSEMMCTRWTRNTVFFMPEKDVMGGEERLPLCAYLPIPSSDSSEALPDFLDEGLLTHRCPRIFDVGVLLLEIGLGRPLPCAQREGRAAQMNLNHRIAISELKKLEELKWDRFANKKYFDSAIKFCLYDENFIVPSKHSRPIRNGAKTSTQPTVSDISAGIAARRRIFYKNVVVPLAWLARQGFKAQPGDSSYVKRKPTVPSQRMPCHARDVPEPEAVFHSNNVPEMWLDNLKRISELVERKRREHRVESPVRIAILDTGLDERSTVFQIKSGLVTRTKDFVDPDASTMVDTFGHGTFMVRLIQECAPGAEILVARVARDTIELKSSRDNIQNAILWAGRDGNADIISMSFGFASEDEGISNAIWTVQKERKEKVIFLASAGNSSTDNESFPARHPSVISVYATDDRGSFLTSNSASTSKGAAVLGTYGDNIPGRICEDMSATYPDVCRPGSSVATAIMAGISATMLRYAHVLPLLVSLQGLAAETSNSILQLLWTTRGMDAVLHRLAQGNLDLPRLKAVKPVWFWKNKPSDTERYCVVFDALSDIRQLSGRTGT